MDLQLYFRVLWRHRLIVVVGIVLAFALAFLSMFKVTLADGSPQVDYRKPEVYQSQATIFVTQRGYPWGRSVYPSLPTGQQGVTTSAYADPGRLAFLASVYAQLATSDAVRAVMLKDGPLRGKFDAVAGFDERNGAYQPYVYVTATATEPAWAVQLANRAAMNIRNVVRAQQVSADIPEGQQVELQIFSKARRVTVAEPRKKTLPVVIFLTVLLATVGLAFVLENMRPRAPRIASVPEFENAAVAEAPASAVAPASAAAPASSATGRLPRPPLRARRPWPDAGGPSSAPPR